ncbi:hypothetical protein BC832DRAFT_408805 [Gaertneriomyces semiglobifer]|nr:hypothetical protein BC832DRAFT_408805 [Gaertneriomyces semiglobifer]
MEETESGGVFLCREGECGATLRGRLCNQISSVTHSTDQSRESRVSHINVSTAECGKRLEGKIHHWIWIHVHAEYAVNLKVGSFDASLIENELNLKGAWRSAEFDDISLAWQRTAMLPSFCVCSGINRCAIRNCDDWGHGTSVMARADSKVRGACEYPHLL